MSEKPKVSGHFLVVVMVVLAVGYWLISWVDGEERRMTEAAARPEYYHGPPEPQAPAARSLFLQLDGGAGFTDGHVWVHNKSRDAWTDVKMEVNGTYTHTTAGIPPGETYRFFPALFTQSDGTRLNPDLVTVQRIDIHASVPGGRGHWNGAY